MLNLDSTTEKIQVVTSDGSGDVEVSVSYSDLASGNVSAFGEPLASITTATTTDIVAAPGSSTTRNVRGLMIRNKSASVTQTALLVRQVDGTDTVDLAGCALLPGECLILDQSGLWTHYDANMAAYQAIGSFATQAEMEAGTAVDKAVSPGRQHNHPSACKFWVKTTPGNVNAASYNVTSVADSSAGITVITIATDFSSASWCCQATCESTSDTMTVTNLKFVRIGLADQAAGTVSIEVHDGTATTAVLEDPTSWHVMGFGDQ